MNVWFFLWTGDCLVLSTLTLNRLLPHSLLHVQMLHWSLEQLIRHLKDLYLDSLTWFTRRIEHIVSIFWSDCLGTWRNEVWAYTCDLYKWILSQLAKSTVVFMSSLCSFNCNVICDFLCCSNYLHVYSVVLITMSFESFCFAVITDMWTGCTFYKLWSLKVIINACVLWLLGWT